jgi:hypothetical protein
MNAITFETTVSNDTFSMLSDFFKNFLGKKVKFTLEPEEAVKPETKGYDLDELIMSGKNAKEIMAVIHANRDESREAVAARRLSALGCAQEGYWMADDFNAPLDDFKEYM